MKRADRFARTTLCLSLSLIVLGAAAAPRVAQQVPRFRGGTDAVSIYATVVDDGGRFVPGLTRDAFEVFDNGVRQEISLFADTVQPITVVVMIDRSSSVEKHFGLVQDAAAAFVRNLLPDDRARIGSFSGRVQIDPETFTSDRMTLLRILDRLQEAGPTPLWNASVAALDALAAEPGRRVALVFTDGKDSSSPLAGNATFGDVRARVERDDVMFYAIGLATKCPEVPSGRLTGAGAAPVDAMFQRGGTQRGRPPGRGGVLRPPIGPGRGGIPRPGVPRIPPPTPFPKTTGSDKDKKEDPTPCRPTEPEPGLRDLAALGGGGYYELERTGDLVTTFARIADELHHQYLLAIPASSADGQVHQIEVRVRPANLTVRARRSYVAPAK